jgi:hypothetical protein
LALLGAVAMFVWEAAAHMFTPLGKAGISYLPNESTVSAALTSSIGDRHGLYAFWNQWPDERIQRPGEAAGHGANRPCAGRMM